MKCIIPCAGLSSRMHYIPKHLVTVKGKPLMQWVTDYWRSLNDDVVFVFVVRPSMGYLLEFLPRGSITVFQEDPRGLADAILRAKPLIFENERFVVSLGDCVFKGIFEDNGSLGVGVWKTEDESETLKSYITKIEGARITKLIEKPRSLEGFEKPYNCGMGVYVLDDRLFDFIEDRRDVDFTEVLQNMVDSGINLYPKYFEGDYVNVGSPEDLSKAEQFLE